MQDNLGVILGPLTKRQFEFSTGFQLLQKISSENILTCFVQ